MRPISNLTQLSPCKKMLLNFPPTPNEKKVLSTLLMLWVGLELLNLEVVGDN